MKKFYFFALTAILALCCGFTASAVGGGSVTVKWDVPASLQFKVGSQAVEVPADATEYTFTLASGFQNLRIESVAPRIIETANYVNGDKSGTININNQGYVSVGMANTTYNGSTITITTKELVKDGKITLNIENGASYIDQIYFPAGNRVGNEYISLDKGNGTYEIPIYNGRQTQIYVAAKAGFSIYSFNGKTANETGNNSYSFGNANKNLTIQVTDNGVYNIRMFENEEPAPESYTVTLAYAEGIENCLKSVFNLTTYTSVTVTDNKFELDQKGQKIRLNFDEDYNITSINNGDIAYDATNHTAEFTVNDNMTVNITGTPKVYGKKKFSIYATNGEGITVWEGSMHDGNPIELGEGTDVSTDLVLKAVTEDGFVVDKEYTIPAGTAKLYQIEVSEKYGTYSVYEKDGYYIAHGRLVSGGSQSNFVIPAAANSYLAVNKVNRDKNFTVVVNGDPAKVNLRSGGDFGGAHGIELTGETTTVAYDPEYDGTFTVSFVLETEGQVVGVYYGGKALKADDYGRYTFTPTEGGVLRLFNNGTNPAYTVKFDVASNLSVNATADNVAFDTTAEQTFCSGTEVAVTAGDACEYPDFLTVSVNDTELTAAEGKYSFTVTENANVRAAYQTYYELFPSAYDETVESLAAIEISFPLAVKVEKVMADDEIMFQRGQAWASMVTVEESTEHSCPAFIITPNIEPTASGVYNFYAPEGFFMIDGVESPEIMVSYTLMKQTELSYSFEPKVLFPSEWGLQLAVAFDETHIIKTNDNTKISLKYNDKVLTAGTDYEVVVEGTMLMFGLTETGTPDDKIELTVEEGAISFNDGTSCPALSHVWTVIEEKTHEVVVSLPDSPSLSDLASFTLTIPTATSAIIAMPTGISLRKSDYTYFGTATITAVETAEPAAEGDAVSCPTFKIEFATPPTEDGTYVLSVSAGTFYVDNAFDNVAFTKTYGNVSGVENIAIDGSDADSRVFNLQGQPVSTEWDNLPAGFYIRNGEKIYKH